MNIYNTISLIFGFMMSASLCSAQCNCGNGVLDVADGETGIDCGGPCLPCTNMVTNGSFEAHAGPFDCFISTLGNIDLASPWTWAHSTEKPDHMHSCHSDANVQTPGNYLGNQAPNSGCGYAAILVHQDMFSDPRAGYIQAPLNSAMTAGGIYQVTYYVSRCDNRTVAIPEISAYFSTGAIAPGDYAPLGPAPHNLTPQINYTNPPPASSHIVDATSWTMVQANYTATGGEDNITIGNFYQRVDPGFPQPFNVWTINTGFDSRGYYYIDDVSVIQIGGFLPVELISFEGKASNTSIELTWETASEIDNDYFTIYSSHDGIDFKPIITREGSGNSSHNIVYTAHDLNPQNGWNYYRLEQTDFDGTSKMFHSIAVEFEHQLRAKIYPNPNVAKSFNIDLKEAAEDVNICMRDAFGKIVFKQSMSGAKLQISPNLPKGLYIVELRVNNELTTLKYIQE